MNNIRVKPVRAGGHGRQCHLQTFIRRHSRVQVESGAGLLLTTPAANRAFRMPGGSAELELQFEVTRGGWLEFWPELFIPQAGARYRQRTVIRAEPGAELLFFEAMAPGRVASGEVFAFASLRDLPDLERLKADGVLQTSQGEDDLDIALGLAQDEHDSLEDIAGL